MARWAGCYFYTPPLSNGQLERMEWDGMGWGPTDNEGMKDEEASWVGRLPFRVMRLPWILFFKITKSLSFERSCKEKGVLFPCRRRLLIYLAVNHSVISGLWYRVSAI